MGENRKQVNAILRRAAERAEAAKKMQCRVCSSVAGPGWNYCPMCGTFRATINDPLPSFADPPFACPPDKSGEGA